VSLMVLLTFQSQDMRPYSSSTNVLFVLSFQRYLWWKLTYQMSQDCGKIISCFPQTDHRLCIRFCRDCWYTNSINDESSLPSEFRGIKDGTQEMLTRLVKPANLTKSTHYPKYLKSEVNSVLRKICRLKDKPEEFATYKSQRLEFVKRMYAHNDAIDTWKARRKKEKLDIERERKEAIVTKLTELGYKEEDFPSELDKNWRSMLCQPRPLTPRIWSQIEKGLFHAIKAEKARKSQQALESPDHV